MVVGGVVVAAVTMRRGTLEFRWLCFTQHIMQTGTKTMRQQKITKGATTTPTMIATIDCGGKGVSKSKIREDNSVHHQDMDNHNYNDK